MTATALIPAARYLRMSTDDQQFSIANQQAAIQKYAEAYGYTIVASYSDPGRSGVTIQGRPGLNKLIQDVVSGHATYKAILVYDVSRWGRFQDEDEAGHYEFLCRRAGIPVRYCGEPFENNGMTSNSIMKALKRTMAAEYSRELGVKVFTGQKRLAELGFRMAGLPGYGLSRCLVSADGRKKRVLRPNERKAIKSEHVILVPGRTKEVDCVRMIFDLAANPKNKTCMKILDELNRRKIKFATGRPWTKSALYHLLRNEKYIGSNIWGKTCTRLGGPVVNVSPDRWTRKPEAFAPIVDPELFHRVQRLIDKRRRYPAKPDEYLLRGMRRVLAREGKLTEKLLKGRGIFDYRTYCRRFGSVMHAYELVGYKPSEHAFKSVGNAIKLRRLRLDLLDRIKELFPYHVRIVRLPSQTMRQVIELDTGARFALHLCRPRPSVFGQPRWLLQAQPLEHDLPALVCTVNPSLSSLTNFYVIPNLYGVRRFVIIRQNHPLILAGVQIESLSQFYEAARACVPEPTVEHKTIIGDVTISSLTFTITIGRRHINLGPTAYELFTTLLLNAEKVVSREELGHALPLRPVGGGFLTPHMAVLRNRLGSAFRRRICTIIGQGYIYTERSMPSERVTAETVALSSEDSPSEC